MIDRSLRVRDDLVADSASYNMLMTAGLRAELGPSVWGNWTLSRTVEAGMVGVVDPVSGAFELHKYGAIPLDVEVAESVEPRTWHHRSASVEESGEGTDEVSWRRWRFPESHTIVSCGTQYARRAVVDPVRAAYRHYDQLLRYADARGYATCDGIVQGFGVVTATYEAVGAVNLAARKADQTFAVEGPATGVATLVGDADPYLAAHASYRTSGPPTDGVEAFLYPGRPDHTGPGTVPYAFEFLSFAGRTALPGWVAEVPTVSVSIRNEGSYVVQCTVTYDTAAASNLRKRVQVGCGIPGWVSLPVDATNVRVSCRFWHVDDWGPRHDLAPVPSPTQEWRQGQGTVEIRGWWPGDYEAAWAT